MVQEVCGSTVWKMLYSLSQNVGRVEIADFDGNICDSVSAAAFGNGTAAAVSARTVNDNCMLYLFDESGQCQKRI